MSDTPVTIVVVPRERFSFAVPALESIYAHTTPPFRLIYVDARSPAHVARQLRAQAAEKGFELIRVEHYLAPNQARNLGQARVDSEFVVFIDNDAIVTPGWLDRLLDCARTTGAWAVEPLYLEGPLEDRIVHAVGGWDYVAVEDGRRVFHHSHEVAHRPASEAGDALWRKPVGALEFHCVLARNAVFDRLGPLDEELMSHSEHHDFAMLIQEAGGSIYLEPESVISFPNYHATPLAWSDIPYFWVRWSDAWAQRSSARFQEKWELPDDDGYLRLMKRFSLARRKRFAGLWFPWRISVRGRERMILALPTERLLRMLFSPRPGTAAT